MVKWSAGHAEYTRVLDVACAPLDHGTKRRIKTGCVLHLEVIRFAVGVDALAFAFFAADAVALLLEQSHREADDQGRQSARFAHTEALAIESAALCQARAGTLVQAADVQAALAARTLRHNQP